MAGNKLPEPAVRDDPHVVALVTRVSGGDQDAWNELADRYGAHVYTICTLAALSGRGEDQHTGRRARCLTGTTIGSWLL